MNKIKNNCFSDQEKVNILKDLVNINTSNGNEIEAAKYIKELLEKFGISSTIIPIVNKRVDLVAEIGTGKPILGISGHMDVVPAGDESNWSSDPFNLEERDNKIIRTWSSRYEVGFGSDDHRYDSN